MWSVLGSVRGDRLSVWGGCGGCDGSWVGWGMCVGCVAYVWEAGGTCVYVCAFMTANFKFTAWSGLLFLL